MLNRLKRLEKELLPHGDRSLMVIQKLNGNGFYYFGSDDISESDAEIIKQSRAGNPIPNTKIIIIKKAERMGA